MPLLVDSTIGSPTMNSYCSVAEATAILVDQRLYSATVWAGAAAADDQAKSLIWATAFLDQMVDWNGYIYKVDQPLRWPRSGVFDLDGVYIQTNVIPKQIKQITAQVAFEYLRQNRQQEPSVFGQGISDVTVGPIHVAIDMKQDIPFFPPYLETLIEAWGVIRNKGGSGDVGMSRLIRT